MKWLTQKQVRAAGKKSALAAAQCSYEHWMQIKTAGAKELRKALDEDRVDSGVSWCALCIRHGIGIGRGECLRCPLGPTACCREYEKAQGAFVVWGEQHGTTYKGVQKAITPLTNRLRKIVKDASRTLFIESEVLK